MAVFFSDFSILAMNIKFRVLSATLWTSKIYSAFLCGVDASGSLSSALFVSPAIFVWYYVTSFACHGGTFISTSFKPLVKNYIFKVRFVKLFSRFLAKKNAFSTFFQRRVGDSNPRYPVEVDGLAIRCITTLPTLRIPPNTKISPQATPSPSRFLLPIKAPPHAPCQEPPTFDKPIAKD